MSSFLLTNSMIFQRGRYTTKQFVNSMMDFTGFHYPGGKMEVFDNKHRDLTNG